MGRVKGAKHEKVMDTGWVWARSSHGGGRGGRLAAMMAGGGVPVTGSVLWPWNTTGPPQPRAATVLINNHARIGFSLGPDRWTGPPQRDDGAGRPVFTQVANSSGRRC